MTLNKRVMVRLSDEVYEELTRVAKYNRRKSSTLVRIFVECALGFEDSQVITIPGANGHPATPEAAP